MDHKRLHYILKICMVILLLVLAYFLPRLCAHRMLEQKMQKQVIEFASAE